MSDVWAGIVRVSFVGTRGGDSFHADRDQVAAIEAYAARHGATVEFMAPELSVSGGLPIDERPSLRAAIEGVESGRYQGIVVGYLSRLTRSRSGQVIWERVEARGGTVHCAAEAIDTSTPNGRYLRDIHLANAVREREEAAEHFALRKRMATAEGIWSTRVVPRGYRKDPKTRRLVEDDFWAEVIRQVFEDRENGVRIAVLAERIGFTESGLRRLLRNRVYLGEVKNGPNVNPDAHPAIITRAQFDAVQSGRIPQPPRSKRDPGLLGGLVRCAACGHRMTRNSRTDPSYVCKKQSSGGTCPAPSTITVERLDGYVAAVARAELDRIHLTDTVRSDGSSALHRAAAEADAELSAYLEAVSAAGISPERFAAGAQSRQRKLDEALAAVRRAESLRPSFAPVVTLSGAEAWDGMTTEERRLVLGRLLEAVVIRKSPLGRWAAIDNRVRVIAGGSAYDLPVRRGEIAMGVRALEWPDLGDERVLRVAGGEHPF